MSDQPSTKPYLIRAIHEWCADNGFRPYIAVAVDETTEVPMEFVRGGEIVLNVSAEATHRLLIGNERIEFEARFNRIARQVSVPVANVTAIYAAENGHGMAFEVAKPLAQPSPARGAPALRAADAPQPASTDIDAAPEPAPSDVDAAPEPAKAPRRRTRARKADAAAPSPMALVALPSAAPPAASPSSTDGAPTPPDPVPPPAGGRPRLTRVK